MKIDFYIHTPESPFWKNKKNFEETINLISSYGYDGIEFLPFYIKKINVNYIKKLVYDNKLKVVCIASGFLNIHYGLSISHPNEYIRRLAIENLKDCINLASKIEAKYVSIGLIRGKIINSLLKKGWKNIIKSLVECGKYAQKFNVFLLIEPENRYETSYIHTVKDGIKTLEEIGMNNFGLMIDTYHMNIEESSIEKAVKDASRKLLHVHLADNNRLAPGMGHFDFKSFIKYLKEVSYNYFLGIEVDPSPSLDIAIKEGIKFIKNIV